MKLYIVIATRGRPELATALCRQLQRQVLAADRIVVAGTQESDVAPVRDVDGRAGTPVDVMVCPAPGSCAQRNSALDHLRSVRQTQGETGRYAVAFLDDDFWPGPTWLRACRDALLARPDAMGLTGRLLGDGAHLPAGLTTADADDLLDGRRPPIPHWHGSTEPGEVACAYGCNMVFIDTVCERYRFDENLPLYGWQEDLDLSTLARRHGPLLYEPGCIGVHLGVKSGRTSGLRFGYSQIANPLYLIRKGTMERRRALRFVLRHLLSNSVRGLRHHPLVDYRGRLRGNLMAMRDLVAGRCHPRRIETLR
ncbi:glycosyltransferase family 2 protein [Ideonella sp. A 288]|uniref:glycosyltransferase family 2 protein n=1 Tax=Ideonella sp. A 288 TaxID=1962181 RepID=UPI000B4B39DE|nr:glycosyltransferase family A protein [Ideonella sp. A 288]